MHKKTKNLKPIMLTLAGGLGNQLFQVAAGYYIEQQLKREILYNISNLTDRLMADTNNYTRNLEVEQLIQSRKKIAKNKSFNLNKIQRFIHRKFNRNSVLIEDGPHSKIINQVADKTISIYGYFQDYEIVEQVWPQLKAAMMMSQKFSKLIDLQKKERVAIHLRFGDYKDDKNTKQTHGLTTMQYFEQAVTFFRKKQSNLIKTLIITDDLNSAKNFAKDIGIFDDVELISNMDPLDDLFEIASSSHIVMSNSTFSWWGAWIGFKTIGADVVFPRPWYANELDPDLPIFVPEWKSIPRQFEI